MPVSLRKPIYDFPKLRGLYLAHDRPRRIRTTLVLDELSKLRRTFIRGERLVEASGSVRHVVLDLPDVLHAPSEPLGHRLIRRGSCQLSRKLVVGAGHLAHLLAHVDGNPDGPPLLSNRPLYGLTYPPRSIGGEPKAPLGEGYLLLVGQELALADSG